MCEWFVKTPARPGATAPDRKQARCRTGDEAAIRPGEERRKEEWGGYGKIKLHLTRDGSPRHIGRSHEARPLWDTS